MSDDLRRTWKLRSRSVDLSSPVIMGILNVTPDSFSDGGDHVDPSEAIEFGLSLAEAGADIVDVGGESTRPGAEAVTGEVELERVIPVVSALSDAGVTVSIDTMKPAVADAAVAAGAEIVNDVSGLRDPAMRRVAVERGVGVVVMHMRGLPRTMQEAPVYEDVVAEVASYLDRQARLCVSEGMDPEQVCIDPGIGFGKTLEHNLQILARLDEIVATGWPVMLGTSRKSFLGALLDLPDPRSRDGATAVTTALAFERGVVAVRVHDPAASRRSATLARAIVEARVDPSSPSP